MPKPEKTSKTDSETQAIGTPNILPRPDFRFPGEIGRTYLDSDPAQFPQPVAAPKGAPNILLILIDDCGFGEYGTFGGGIPSPTMDTLAAEGLPTQQEKWVEAPIGLCRTLRRAAVRSPRRRMRPYIES